MKMDLKDNNVLLYAIVVLVSIAAIYVAMNNAGTNVRGAGALINGACGSSLNTCSAGTLQDVVDTNIYYQWKCVGTYTGSTANCYKTKVIDKSCGSDRTSTCMKSPCYVFGMGTDYTGTCTPEQGGMYCCKGSSVSNCEQHGYACRIMCNWDEIQEGLYTCSNFQQCCKKDPFACAKIFGQHCELSMCAPRWAPGNGNCPAGRSCCGVEYTCTQTSGQSCKSYCSPSEMSGFGTCELGKICCRQNSEKINGVCGSSLNTCSAGTLQDIADSSTQYLWNCVGINSGTTASCSRSKQ